MNVLVIIPARGGSKGIPGKNIIDVCGKPLIAYSILIGRELVNAGLAADCIVSTDDDEIADVAKNWGASVPFKRPNEFASDTAKTIDVITHALDWHERNKKQVFDAILLLQPTSPLRTVEETIKSLELFAKGGSESLISVYREEYINDLVMYKYAKDQDIIGVPLNILHNKGVRRQDHGHVYVRNGSIYITSVALIKKGFIISDQPILFEMDRSSSINLDTVADLDLLRKHICK